MNAGTGMVWFMTGCSSGLGRALAEVALERGERVVLTARQPASIEDLARRFPATALPRALDINDDAQVAAALAAAEQRFGRIDVLVNNAGFLQLGAVEEASDAEYRGMFETNFFAPLRLIRAVLPQMRERRDGWIVNIGSVGAFNPRAGASAYSAAKAALDAASEALATEVAPFGIKVVIVVLGAFRTQVMESMTYAARPLDAYAPTAHATREHFLRNSGRQAGDPRKAAAAIVDAVRSGHAPLRLPLGPGSVDRVRAKLAAVTRDIDAGAAVAGAVVYES